MILSIILPVILAPGLGVGTHTVVRTGGFGTALVLTLLRLDVGIFSLLYRCLLLSRSRGTT